MGTEREGGLLYLLSWTGFTVPDYLLGIMLHQTTSWNEWTDFDTRHGVLSNLFITLSYKAPDRMGGCMRPFTLEAGLDSARTAYQMPYIRIAFTLPSLDTRTLWTTTLTQEYWSWQEHETLPLFLTCLHELVDLEPDTRNHVASLVSHSNLYIPAAYEMDGSSTYPYLDLLCQTPSTMGGVPLPTPSSTQEGRPDLDQ